MQSYTVLLGVISVSDDIHQRIMATANSHRTQRADCGDTRGPGKWIELERTFTLVIGSIRES